MEPSTRPRPARTRSAGPFTLAAALALAGCGAGEADPDGSPRAGTATGQATALPGEPPRVRIIEPAEGAELDGASVTIVMEAEHIRLAPAGDTTPGTGHLHLFVNQPVSEAGAAIPIGVEGVVHLGQAQASHELTGLAPGEYTVIAVLGDLLHRAIDPQAVDTVRFRVRGGT